MTVENPRSTQHPVKHFINALQWSLKGIVGALKTEVAFRQEVVGAVILIPVAIFLPLTVGYRLLLVGSILLVLIVELINSAIEAVVDLVSPDYHELAGKAKDCGSAAVFLSLISAGIVWLTAIWRIVR